MLRLAEAMARECISQRRLAKAAGWSATALRHLVRHGEYPVWIKPEQLRQRLTDALRQLGVTDEAVLQTVFEEVATDRGNEPPPGTTLGETFESPELQREDVMLIRKQSISAAARGFFGVGAEALTPPWRRDQVFMGGEMRVAYEHMLAKARFGGVLAIAGESGAGKSTIKDLLVSDLTEAGEIVVIEPHTQAMEQNDKAGKTLKSAHICQAILAEVAPTAPLKLSMEAQLRQVARALAADKAQHKDRRHLLIIDEAHALPIATLRHLKRFIELKDPDKKGLQRPLLHVVLIGQPELTIRLSAFDMDVREVWQRCELVTLPALGNELDAYIRFRLGAAATAFAPAALDALRAKLTTKDGASFLYPLAVDNWLAAILNQAASLGAKTITGETVNEVYQDMQTAMRGGR